MKDGTESEDKSFACTKIGLDFFGLSRGWGIAGRL